MTGKKEKTISGAMYSEPNLEHNLRTHIPPNSVEGRHHLNWVYTKDSEITLQQVYEKLFAKPYKEWRDREIKKGRGKRFSLTYYEKIEQDKQKHLCYEIIWQVGDMRDTGFIYTLDDAHRVQDLLDKRENQELKAENRTLKEKLNKAYEFMKQFTINEINMLELFLRSIGEWVQQKVAGMSR